MSPIFDSTKIAINAAELQAETKKTVEAQPLQNITSGQNSQPHIATELMLVAFSYLNLTELGDCRLLSKQYKTLVCKEGFLFKIYADRAFGKKKWSRFFGTIGEEPALPKNIHSIMQADCPIWEGKKVIETHMLALIPKSVNKQLLTINSLGALVKTPKEGLPTCYDRTWEELFEEFGNQPVDKTHWVLMTTDVLPGSKLGEDPSSSPEQRAALAASYSERAQIEYLLPKVIEAAVCIFTKYFSSGKRVFSDTPWTYTYCQEMIDGYQPVVGGFAQRGLDVFSRCDYGYFGTALLRKL